MRAAFAVGAAALVAVIAIWLLWSNAEPQRDGADSAARDNPVKRGPASVIVPRHDPEPPREALPGRAEPDPVDRTADEAKKRERLRPLMEALRRAERNALARDRDAREGGKQPPRFEVNRDGIRAAIGSIEPQFIDCYESWLQINPELAGKLVVSFRIGAEEDPTLGTVQQAHVKSGGLGNEFLDGCVVAAMSDLHFADPPEGGMAVTYPLVFRNEDAP